MSANRVNPVCLCNLPAGYELENARWVSDHILTTIWLVPGGGRVYQHICTYNIEDEVKSEKWWEGIVERLKHHVQCQTLGLQSYADAISTYKLMAISNRPPTTEFPHVHVPSLEARRTGDAQYEA